LIPKRRAGVQGRKQAVDIEFAQDEENGHIIVFVRPHRVRDETDNRAETCDHPSVDAVQHQNV
jgi:uncharacterized membrane protein YcaP (DUF421 family)